MADRKNVNKYYPPEWEPKHGSINKYRGSHPLRERARKLDQGILVIRFEMPYNIWCEGCNNHIGTGVRYNAEKSKTGNYFSTAIYKFRMKCHLCDNYIEMETDPANLDYKILSGARRQERRWDPTQNEQVVPEDKEVAKQLASDPMMRLEHGVEDRQKRDAAAPVLEKLERIQSRWRDDFGCNQLLRKKFRGEKRVLKETEAVDEKLLKKSSLSIKLLPEDQKDIRMAALIKFEPTASQEKVQQQQRQNILSQSIFASRSSSKGTTTSSQMSKMASAVSAKKVESLMSRNLTKESIGIAKTKKVSPDIESTSGGLVGYDSSDSD